MKFKILNLSIPLAMIGSFFVSCDSFTEIDLPETQLTAQAVFEDEATAKAALMDIYANIRERGPLSGNIDGLSHLMGQYSDELDFYGTATSPAYAFYYHSIIPSNNYVSSLWGQSYSQIYTANILLEGLEKSNALDETFHRQLQGEGLFVRALLHFYLVNLYGEITYITSTDYRENVSVSKMTEQEVYQNIITDLQQAKALLPETYPSTERVRPNKFTATALLARVYLYFQEWELAEVEATQVISSGTYELERDIDAVFLKNSSSTIWQLHPGVNGNNTREARTFIFLSPPPNIAAVSANLLGAFESGDLRKEHWLKSITDGITTWYYPYKYKQEINAGVSEEYSILFRLEELYLIRAEARAHLNDLIGANTDLNTIRNRAGLPDTDTNNPEVLLNDILKERRVELFTEVGHRFLDLKRTGKAGEKLSALKPNWSDSDLLLPIPEKELLLNNNLQPQNPGY